MFYKGDLSVKPINCTPIVFGKVTPEYIPLETWGDEKIEALFENMEKDGINLIMLAGGVGDKVYFPSKILNNQCGYDCYAKIFDLSSWVLYNSCFYIGFLIICPYSSIGRAGAS